MTSRRLFVIGADPHRERAFATWARADLSVTLADGITGAGYEHCVDRFLSVDVRDESADVDRLTRLAAGHDGVTTLSENSLVTAAIVADTLGLPGPGAPAAGIARSKPCQREVNRRYGLPGPRFARVTGAEDLRRFFDGRAVDAVLKPQDAAGSAAVFGVGTLDEALRQWPRVRVASPGRTAIIEEYVPGTEVSVEAVVDRGALAFASVTHKCSGGPTGFLEVSHTTGDTDHLDDGAISALVRDLAAAWTVGSAVLHVELKAGDGHAVPIEATVRPAGDFIPELVNVVHGRDLYHDLACLALGMPLPPARPALAAHAGVRFLLAEGTVRRAPTPLEVMDGRPDVKVARPLAQPGRRLPALSANWSRAGYALGWSGDGESLERQLRAAVGDLGRRMGVAEVSP